MNSSVSPPPDREMMVIVVCDKLHEANKPQFPLEARMHRRTRYDRIVNFVSARRHPVGASLQDLAAWRVSGGPALEVGIFRVRRAMRDLAPNILRSQVLAGNDPEVVEH
jgi:hypothetical protein